MRDWKEKISELWKKQKFGKDSFLIMILGGLLLLIIAWPTDEKRDSQNQVLQSGLMSSSDGMISSTESNQSKELSGYIQAMEERLSRMLESMEGVGKVEVMITYASNYELVPLQQVTKSSSETAEADSSGGSRVIKQQNSSEETVFTMDEQGNQVPYVVTTKEPQIIGIAVSAQGGGNPVIQKNITEVIQSLFRIEANRIIVTRMKS